MRGDDPSRHTPAGHPPARRRHVLIADRRLRTLCLAVAVMNIGYTIIIPVVPVYADRYSIGAATLGLMFTLFALGRALCQVGGGFLTSRYGDRPVAVLAVTLIAFPVLCLAFSVHAGAMLASRLVWGMLEGIAVPALYSLVSRFADPQRQGEALGAFGACAVAGMALGPVVGGYTLPIGGVALPFLIAAGVHLVAGALLYSSARSAGPAAKGQPAEVRPVAGRPASWAASLVAYGAAVALGAVDLANNLAYGMVEPVLPLHLSGLGFSPPDISLVFTLGLVVFTVGSLGLGRLCDRLAPISLMVGTLIIGAAAVATLGLDLGPVATFLVFGAFMLTQCLLYILTRKLMRETYHDEAARARAFGLFGTLSDGGFILGPALGTLAFQGIGRGAFWVFAAAMVPFTGVAIAAGRRRAPRAATT